MEIANLLTWLLCLFSCVRPQPKLVGGFNPFEKYSSNWIISPRIGVNIKNVWNHHLENNIKINSRRKKQQSTAGSPVIFSQQIIRPKFDPWPWEIVMDLELQPQTPGMIPSPKRPDFLWKKTEGYCPNQGAACFLSCLFLENRVIPCDARPPATQLNQLYTRPESRSLKFWLLWSCVLLMTLTSSCGGKETTTDTNDR